MNGCITGAIAGLLAVSPALAQQVTFEIIGPGSGTGVSADGSVVVGNTEDFGTFRWTAGTGMVDLGRNAFVAIGQAAGTPDVSADGVKISASILDMTGTLMTPGLWTADTGWIDLMPPMPPDGGLIDDSYGSAWGMSGDGQVVTGLYWRPGEPDGLAHAYRWTEATGVVDLGSGGRNSRGSGVDWDGSVIVGFDENPGFGNWWPAVWVDGVRTILSQPDAFTSANAVNHDGTVVVGQGYDASIFTLVAAVWRWDGADWNEQQLGVLPGTFPEFGQAICNDVTPDGSLIVGWNSFDFGPFGGSTGFMWTEETGMIDVEQFLIENGIFPNPLFDILTLTAVSDDGRTLVGIGQDWFDMFRIKTFIITLPPPAPGLDIKPGSCPNSFNRISTGVLPVALVGTEDFDVTQVDVDTLMLSRADGVGGAVAPLEGPPGPPTTVDDIATPFDGDACDCHGLMGDGLADLAMKFSSPQLVAELQLNGVPRGELVELVVTGESLDGTPFAASDCIRIVSRGLNPASGLVGSRNRVGLRSR
ncbi:MAG: hypothetical protein ACYSU7_17465 [Planctomycetota bacterium]|jgi:hypothetical protein